MLNPELPVQADAPKPQQKQMLTSQLTKGRLRVQINFSSLDLLQTCMRKAHYALGRNLRPAEPAPALAFGTAIHKALEHWYSLPVSERQLPKQYEEEAELYCFGQRLEYIPTHGALEAIRQFAIAAYPSLSALPEGDKRSMQSGLRILKAYFKHYAEDGFEVARDHAGKPLVEKQFNFPMFTGLDFDGTPLDIDYFGQIDVILRNAQTGVLVVADHKTTSALGKEFYDRCKPNPQYTGYVWAAQHMGIDTKLFMINGIQTLKTKTEFARQITERNEDDFSELRLSVKEAVYRWLRANKDDSYPMSAPNPCSMYGGCTYRKVCELPHNMREQVIKLEYS